jgi:hypothetical protein
LIHLDLILADILVSIDYFEGCFAYFVDLAALKYGLLGDRDHLFFSLGLNPNSNALEIIGDPET